MRVKKRRPAADELDKARVGSHVIIKRETGAAVGSPQCPTFSPAP